MDMESTNAPEKDDSNSCFHPPIKQEPVMDTIDKKHCIKSHPPPPAHRPPSLSLHRLQEHGTNPNHPRSAPPCVRNNQPVFPCNSAAVSYSNYPVQNPHLQQQRQMIVIKPEREIKLEPGCRYSQTTSSAGHCLQTEQEIANGRTPDKETVIEITELANPADGYFSRENLIKSHDSRLASHNNDTFSKLSSGPFSRLTHPRKSPPLKRFYRTPSPPRIHAQPPQESHAVAECYYTGSIKPRPASALAAPTLSRIDLPCSATANCATAMLRASTPNPTTSCAHSRATNSITVKSNGVTRTIAILNRNRTTTQNMHVIQPLPIKPCTSTSTCIPSVSEEQRSSPLIKAESKLNTSLTNIQWLGEMKAVTGDDVSSQCAPNHKELRVIASEKQIAQISAECGRKKRPPYSYMHLIQMAICSREDRHLTLRDIYKWIEDKFAYYKYHPNQGWKNSIRHNLSLYDIFVRKKISVPGKSGTSYWTLKTDIEKPVLSLPNEDSNSELSHPSTPEPLISIDVKPNKKGPVPLLPKPDPSQAYALIPIQGGMPVVSSQPIIVPANWALSRSGQVHAGQIDLNKSGQKRNISPADPKSVSHKKHCKIAPKLELSNLSADSSSQTSWLSNSQSSALDTADLRSQLAHLKFVDSGIEMSSSSLSQLTETDSCNDKSTSDVVCGLPKPMMYTELRRKKRTPRKFRRKQKLPSPVRLNPSSVGDSAVLSVSNSQLSESSIGDILAGIERDLSSPAKMLLRTPPHDKDLMTSTPLKDTLDSLSWISPIRGIASDETVDNIDSHFGRDLFTPPPENSNKTSTPLEGKLSTPELHTPTKHALHGIKIQCSPPLGSLQSFGLAGLTPLKSPAITGSPETLHNSSFTKLFGEFHLENIIDDNIDIANFSFSNFQDGAIN